MADLRGALSSYGPAYGKFALQSQPSGGMLPMHAYGPVPPKAVHSEGSAGPGVEINPNKPTELVGIDMAGMSLRVISPSLFRFSHITVLYLSGNGLTRIPTGMARMAALTVLDLSNNRLQSLPSDIGDLVRLRELLLYNNLLSTLPFELGRLFMLQVLGLAGNPLVEPFLSLAQEGASALVTFLLDNGPVRPAPPERPWVQLPLPDDVSLAPAAEGFSVMCYNVLCDKYATRQLYGYCPTWALEWGYRKQRILQEILTHNADIVCLQEVETEQFVEFFHPELQRHGYGGVFHPKSRARTMSDEKRRFVDGCAIFFRNSRFALVRDYLMEFNQLATANALDADSKENMLNRVMTKDNIAVAALLECRVTQTPLFVANAHIHWDPSFKDVKMVQCAMLMEEIRKTIAASRKLRIPILVCGDFNSLPDSGVYEFMANGRLANDHSDFEQHSYGNFMSNGFRHPYNMRSAYSHIGELPFTDFTYEFTGVIDYIWYTADRMVPSGVLGPVSEDYLSKFLGCPNAHFPSDHIPLVAEMRLVSSRVPSQPEGVNGHRR